MLEVSWYCDFAPGHPIHGPYHEFEYGFPLRDEAALCERLSLEIFQAGLSWLLILKKRPAIVSAFGGFHVDTVSAYGPEDQQRLLLDPGIIRNRRKISAIISNARCLQELRGSHGGFAGWLDQHHPRAHADWTQLFRETFQFTGGEVVKEFLMSTGYLPGAHRRDCPVYERITRKNPPWLRPEEQF